MEIEGMKITVVGVLLILAVVVLIALLVHSLLSEGGANPSHSSEASS
ncbi:MAG TPA: hypothetical protein VN822_11680 [Candidatus Acidoferrales bacterium]|nr:hypothetical protein [Candidatus Acidoferrales bacterium]